MLPIDQDISLTGQKVPDDGDGILLLVGETPEGETVRFEARGGRIYPVDEFDD